MLKRKNQGGCDGLFFWLWVFFTSAGVRLMVKNIPPSGRVGWSDGEEDKDSFEESGSPAVPCAAFVDEHASDY